MTGIFVGKVMYVHVHVRWVTVQHLGLRAVRSLGSCGSRFIHE